MMNNLVNSYERRIRSLWRQFFSDSHYRRNGFNNTVAVRGRALVQIAQLRAIIDDIETGRL